MSGYASLIGDPELAPEADPPVRRTHMQRRIRQMLVGVFLLDAGVLFVTSCVAWMFQGSIDGWWSTPPYPYHYMPVLGPGLLLVWLVMLVGLGAYRIRSYGSGFEEFRAITMAGLFTLAIAGFGGFLAPEQPTRGYPILFFLLGTPVLLAARYLDRQTLHRARVQGRLANRVIAVGSPAAVAELVEVLARAPYMGYRVVGMCVPRGEDTVGTGVPVLGDVGDVRDVAVKSGADTVLVAGGSYSSAADLRRLGWALEGLGLDMLVVPSLTDIAGPRVHMHHVAGLPLVHVDEPQFGRAGGWAKRSFDLGVATVLVVVLAVPMLACALVIWLQDRGPVLYRQARIGRDGAEFQMVKFRSMVVDADRQHDDLDLANERDVLFKAKDDPRVTSFGSFIRRYSIDELPQLVNVFKGEMSLVGPRPLFQRDVDRYENEHHRRTLVRPGMTGLWQVSGRSDLSWTESVRLDLYYVDNWSMVTDLVIMLKTIRAVVAGQGAY